MEGDGGGSGSGVYITKIGGVPVCYTTATSTWDPQPVEQMALAWLDGSKVVVTTHRPPGWQQGMPEGQAEEFRQAVEQVLFGLLSGNKSAGLEVVADEESTTFEWT